MVLIRSKFDTVLEEDTDIHHKEIDVSYHTYTCSYRGVDDLREAIAYAFEGKILKKKWRGGVKIIADFLSRHICLPGV